MAIPPTLRAVTEYLALPQLSRAEIDELRYMIAKAGYGFVRPSITSDGRITGECRAWLAQHRRVA